MGRYARQRSFPVMEGTFCRAFFIHNHITDPSCNRVKVYGHIDCFYHPQGWYGGNSVPFFIALIFGEGTADFSFKIRPLPFRHPVSEGKAKMKPADKNKTSSWSERRETANTSWETPDDRRHKMQEYLSAKRKVTYRELADEYGITRRTAMRDIEILTASIPLETVPGNGGGVKVMDGWHSNRLYMSEDQKLLLIELRETLTGKKREIMESILTDFIMPIT